MTTYGDRVDELAAELLTPDVDGGTDRTEELMHQMIELLYGAYLAEREAGLSQTRRARSMRKARAKQYLRVVP